MFLNISFISHASAIRDYPQVNLHAGDGVWIDQRINCLNCRYPLKSQDVIMFSKGARSYFGRIVHMPFEMADIYMPKKSDRSIASNFLMEVPDGKLAVQLLHDSRKTILVPVEKIDGLLTNSLSEFIHR